MNILAIDTTTKKANVGVCIENIKTIKTIDNEITHSEKLLPLIDEVLKEVKCDIKDIDLISCTTGPGSFTGIRIGLATAKALAKVIDAKIYAINSLELLANKAINDGYRIIVPLINAKNTRAYYGIYENITGNLKQIHNLGNNYIKEILNEVINYCSSNNIDITQEVLFVMDSGELIDLVCEENKYNYTIQTIDLSILIDLSLACKKYSNYIELDATYVRSSEAERTKYGE